jgi:hypothetical protein
MRRQTSISRIIIAGLFAMTVAPALAAQNTDVFEQSYESCAVNAEGIFSAIRDYQSGVPETKAVEKWAENGLRAYKLILNKGVEHAYISAHVHYFMCAKEIDKRKPLGSINKNSIEGMYAGCASKHGERFVVLDGIIKGISKSNLRSKFSQHPHILRLVDTVYGIVEEGSKLKAFMMSAEAHRACYAATRKEWSQ